MDTTMRIVLLCFGMISSAEGLKELTAVVGGNITLPDSIMERGFLTYGTKLLASVRENKMEIEEEIYTDKLHWDKKTGRFTIMNLQRSDSGIYALDNKKGIYSQYNLTVFDPAPRPAVMRLNDSSEPCLLECWVETATKLSWHRDGKILNQSSSNGSLRLAVDKQDFSSSYTCVSANPAENKTLEADINTLCGDGSTPGRPDGGSQRHYWIGSAVSITSILFVLVAAWLIKRKCLGQKRTIRQTQGSEHKEEEVQYTQIHRSADQRRQESSGPDPSGVTPPVSSLTTVYDKIEAHRILSEDPVSV